MRHRGAEPPRAHAEHHMTIEPDGKVHPYRGKHRSLGRCPTCGGEYERIKPNIPILTCDTNACPGNYESRGVET